MFLSEYFLLEFVHYKTQINPFFLLYFRNQLFIIFLYFIPCLQFLRNLLRKKKGILLPVNVNPFSEEKSMA